MLGLGGATAGGLLLLCAGTGLLAGETLRAEAAPDTVGTGVRWATAVGNPLPQLPELVKAIAAGMSGLTPGRSLVFAGVALLAVSSVAAAVALAGADGAGDGTGVPSAEPSASATSDPSASSEVGPDPSVRPEPSGRPTG